MRATGTNLRLYEMGADLPSLFPPCSLQGTVQLKRVRLRRAQTLFTAMWSRKAMRRGRSWFRVAVGFEDRRASNCVSSPRGAPPRRLRRGEPVAGTHIPETVVMDPRLRGDDGKRIEPDSGLVMRAAIPDHPPSPR